MTGGLGHMLIDAIKDIHAKVTKIRGFSAIEAIGVMFLKCVL